MIQEPIAVQRSCDAVLAVMCPDLPQLSEGLVQHSYLFVLRVDDRYAVTYEGATLLCPYGSVFKKNDPLTPEMALWFEAGMRRTHDAAERSTDPWTLIP